MINKKSEIDYEKIISQLKVGDYIVHENYTCAWVIDEIYGKYDKYCKCHLKYIGSYEYEDGEWIEYGIPTDDYDEIKIFKYCDIAQAIKENDDNTFDLETAFKEVLNIE